MAIFDSSPASPATPQATALAPPPAPTAPSQTPTPPPSPGGGSIFASGLGLPKAQPDVPPSTPPVAPKAPTSIFATGLPSAPAAPGAPKQPQTIFNGGAAPETPLQHVKAAGKSAFAPVATAFRAVGFGLSRPGQAVEHAISTAISEAKTTDTVGVTNVLHAAWQGLSGETQDVTGAQIMGQLGIKNKIAQDVAGFATDVLTDPLTYAPVADLAELAKVPEGFNLVLKAAKAVPGVAEALDAAGKVFDKYHGVSQAFRQSWQGMEGKNAAAEQRVAGIVKQAFQGVDPGTRAAYLHAVESGAFAPAAEAAEPAAAKAASVATAATPKAATYDEAQKAIDDFETKLSAKYGENAVITAPLEEPTGAFAGMKQETPISEAEIQRLRELYAARDAIGTHEDTTALSSVMARIPRVQGEPATEQEVRDALGKLQKQANLSQAMGHATPQAAAEFARQLYVSLSHKLAARGAMPEALAGDADLAAHVAQNFHASPFGTSPAPLIEQIGRIVKAVTGEAEPIAKELPQLAAPAVSAADASAPVAAAAQAIDPALQAIHKIIGPIMETNGQSLADRKLIRSRLENYMPHILSQRFQQGFGIWSNIKSPLRAFTPASISRKLDGTVAEINKRFAESPDWAEKAGLDPKGKFFEDDAAKVLYSHLLTSAQAIHLHDFLQEALSKAIKVTKKSDIPLVLPEGIGVYRPNTLKFFKALMASPDAVDVTEEGSKVVPLEELHQGLGVGRGPVYLLPKAEAEWLNGALRYRGGMNGLLRPFEALRSMQLKLMLLNPFVHFPHNVMWNAYLRDPGAVLNPAEWAQHVKGVVHGVDTDPWLKRATEAGAVPTSAVLNYRGPIAARANDIAKDLTKSQIRHIVENITPSQISNHATWIPENAMRVALFRRAAQKGMDDAGAADWVNQALGNHRNLSNAERNIQTFLLPFYNWEKTALVFNLGQLYHNTNRATIPLHILNSINQATAGHPMSMNPDGKQFDLQLGPDAAGNQRFLNVYNPLLETLGIGERGAPSYLFNRFSGVVRTPFQGVTGLSSPFAGPQSNYPLIQYPELQGTPFAKLNDVPLYQTQVFGGIGKLIGAPGLSNLNRGPLVGPEEATTAQQVLSLPGNYAPAVPLGPGMQVAGAFGAYPLVQAAGAPQRTQKYNASQIKSQVHSAIRKLEREGKPIPPGLLPAAQ